MNWFEQVEQKRTLLIGGIVTICLFALAVSTLRNNISYDSFWHLQMGIDWLVKGLAPWLDHFSFTFNGKAIAGPPYLFEAIIGWLVLQLGLEPGFQVFKFSAFLLIFMLVLFFLRKLRAPVLVYALVLPLLVLLIQLRASVRPELISYSLSVIAVMLYYRARTRMTVSTMLPILGLIFIWSNYHSPIFGYIIFFGYFIDIALLQIRDRAPFSIWLEWLGWGLAVIAVGFLTPGFQHPLLQIFFFSPQWKMLIQEYQSAVLYQGVAAIYSLIVISVLTLLLLLRERQIGLLLVCGLLIFFSISMARLVTPAGIVILCIFAWAVSDLGLEKQLRGLTDGWSKAIAFTALTLFVLSLASMVNLARAFMEEKQTSATIFPEDVADYMIDQGISGRIFNEYQAGGYLIYRLSPDSQVYIDGRTAILYPVEHYQRFLAAKSSPEALRIEIEKYDINLAILENNPYIYRLMADADSLGLDYVGSKYSLFRRNKPNFQILGALLAYPACWNAGMSSVLEEERTRAIWFLPPDSMLFPFMEFVMAYTLAADKTMFLQEMGQDEQWTDEKLRFAGYRALDQNLDQMAYELFAGIGAKHFSDYLAGTLAKTHLNQWQAAEQLIDSVTRISWPEVKYSHLVILYGLLVHIHKNAPLELIDEDYVDQLSDQLGASRNSNTSIIPDTGSFCPDT